MKEKRKLIIHPFFFAIYAGLAPLAMNIWDVRLAGIRALLFVIGGSIILVTLMRLLIKDQVKAGLISSSIIILFFLYGHIAALLQNQGGDKAGSAQNIFLGLLWVVVLAVWIYWVLKKAANPGVVSDYLNWVSFILIVFPFYSVAMFARQSLAIESLIDEYRSETLRNGSVLDIVGTSELNIGGSRPDIYYIVLDAYTRSDVLEEVYNYDNSEFVKSLQERGFYVAKASRANYTYTTFSIASSLNMMHINNMPEFFRQRTNADDLDVFQEIAGKLIFQNRVSDYLKEQGYALVSFDSGYAKTKVENSDYLLSSPKVKQDSSPNSVFELMIWDTSIGRIFTRLRGDEFPLESLFDAHRERILFTFANLPKFADLQGDYFVYAHIISPHIPYVFGPEGEEREGGNPYTLLDVDPGSEGDVELYIGQLHYINKLVIDMIDQILTKSDTPPIIILQSDHSSKVRHTNEPTVDERMKLLLPILNAYRLPGVRQDQLYATITPVNSFRLLFDLYFGTDLDLLEDDSYIFETIDGNGEFVNACDIYQACLP